MRHATSETIFEGRWTVSRWCLCACLSLFLCAKLFLRMLSQLGANPGLKCKKNTLKSSKEH